MLELQIASYTRFICWDKFIFCERYRHEKLKKFIFQILLAGSCLIVFTPISFQFHDSKHKMYSSESTCILYNVWFHLTMHSTNELFCWDLKIIVLIILLSKIKNFLQSDNQSVWAHGNISHCVWCWINIAVGTLWHTVKTLRTLNTYNAERLALGKIWSGHRNEEVFGGATP